LGLELPLQLTALLFLALKEPFILGKLQVLLLHIALNVFTEGLQFLQIPFQLLLLAETLFELVIASLAGFGKFLNLVI